MTLKEITEAVLQLVQHLLSWPVALVVVLLVFRKQVVELFQEVKSRLKVLQIKDYKLELSEPKTTETAIGKTNISAIPTKFDTDSYVFRSHKFRFEISYPINAKLEVINSPEQPEFLVQQGYSVALQLLWRQTSDEFRPNVNVIIQPVGDISITQYVAVTIQSFAQNRFELDSHSIDLKTAGALFSYMSTFVINDAKGDRTLKLKNVSRVTLSNGLGYVVTSAYLVDSPPPVELRSLLNSVINSFQVLAAQ